MLGQLLEDERTLSPNNNLCLQMTTEQNRAYGGNANIYTYIFIYVSVWFPKNSEKNPLSSQRLKTFLELFLFPGLKIISNQTIP